MKKLLALTCVFFSMVLVGCSNSSKSYDYSAFKESNPKSILIVMPTNSSPDVKADTSVLAQATVPLAEKGYYVFPVALVDEIFKQNGLMNGHDIQATSPQKIQQIFGADAIMYLNVSEYGSQYQIFDSVTTVEVQAKLVDLRNGKTLWTGENKQSIGNSANTGNAITQLISAAVAQIINTTQDKGYEVAGVVNSNLFNTDMNGNILYGPRHPSYGKDAQIKSK